jgi:hypothetical protein
MHKCIMQDTNFLNIRSAICDQNVQKRNKDKTASSELSFKICGVNTCNGKTLDVSRSSSGTKHEPSSNSLQQPHS